VYLNSSLAALGVKKEEAACHDALLAMKSHNLREIQRRLTLPLSASAEASGRRRFPLGLRLKAWLIGANISRGVV
jgi:predicted DNA-binding transcriptional regulator